MNNKDRKVVAAFIADIYCDMVKETQYGNIKEAIRNNVKMLFFASFSENYSNTEYTRLSSYDIGDVAIYKLPNLSNFDGLITYDSYMPELFLDTINNIKKSAPCPAVTLGDVSDCSYNVINDHDKSLAEIIEHLINDHGCTDLVHVAGNMELTFCQDRYNVFKNTLEKNNLYFGEDSVFYGNLWYDCAERIVDQILKKYETVQDRLLPDAIVCANDYSAIGIVDELIKRGYSVPEDTIVTGYDDVIQARYHEPSITTSAQPFEQVGANGIKVLNKIWNGEDVPHITTEPGILMARQSCGCQPKHIYQDDTLRESYAAVITKLGELSVANTNLILSISTAETDTDIFNNIEEACLNETGFQDAVLCLMDNWDKQMVITESKDFDDLTFNVVCGKYKGKSIRREKLEKGQLLPKEMMDDPYAYYLIPIHHLQYFLGYFIISPDLENLSQRNIKSWFINISTMLENWRIKKELKYTVERLHKLYVTDMLTGLYNRRGYGLHFEDYYKECCENKTGLAVFLIDMDNMKFINDNYGHDEGDYCLCTIGNAMTSASVKKDDDDIIGSMKTNEICIRSGGDEFVVLAKNYDETMVKEYISNLRSHISETCKNDNKDFDISVSVGCYLQYPEESEDFNPTNVSEEYLRYADELMYVEKKEHKRQRKAAQENTNQENVTQESVTQKNTDSTSNG